MNRSAATPRNWAGSTQNVTDPRTGLTVQYRDWYDAANGEQVTEVCLLYGAGVGVAGNLHRILSASLVGIHGLAGPHGGAGLFIG